MYQWASKHGARSEDLLREAEAIADAIPFAKEFARCRQDNVSPAVEASAGLRAWMSAHPNIEEDVGKMIRYCLESGLVNTFLTDPKCLYMKFDQDWVFDDSGA